MKNFYDKYCDAIDAGLTLEQFASQNGVTKQFVYDTKYKLRKMGVKIPNFPHEYDWSRKEELSLIKQINQYDGHVHFVSIPGRTINGIRNKATRMGLIGDGVARAQWTADEIEYLQAAISRNTSRKTIAKKLGKSIVAVNKKVGRMNLVSYKRDKFKKLSGAKLDLFHNVIKKLNLTLTPKQIAEYWNKHSDHKVTDKTVRRHRVILGINTNRLFTTDLKNEQAKKRREKEETEAAKNPSQTLI
jgi:transposase